MIRVITSGISVKWHANIVQNINSCRLVHFLKIIRISLCMYVCMYIYLSISCFLNIYSDHKLNKKQFYTRPSKYRCMYTYLYPDSTFIVKLTKEFICGFFGIWCVYWDGDWSMHNCWSSFYEIWHILSGTALINLESNKLQLWSHL